MLKGAKLELLQNLIGTATREELIWMNGYLAGVIGLPDAATVPAAPVAKPAVSKITVVYGTESGNSKKLALDFASRAKKTGVQAKLVSMDQYRLNDLPKEEYLLAVISTQGEGEPPAAAKKFYDHIHQNGFKLDKLKYGVLALGDTSYPLFCKAGEDVDSQLQKLGGNRIVPLRKCDVDFEEEADQWFSEVLESLSGVQQAAPAPAVTEVPAVKKAGKKVYEGTVLSNINLNDRGSRKQTHHIEIAADDVDYEPGDSLGIIPENPQELVECLLDISKADASKTFQHKNDFFTITDLLKKKLHISYLPERVVQKYAAIVQQDIPATRIDLLDLLKIYPISSPEQFEQVITILEPIAPRLYSIASSPQAHAGEIHLTVAKDFFSINNELKVGLCSRHLSETAVDEKLHFYIHKNNQFKLPAPDKDVIMIGPGTGIAPFRSFLSERDATGATGENWLFFGDQHFETDFLYQTEIQNWAETGVLTKVNVAFSRDQQEKIYVQHKMKKHARAFYDWLEAGAYIYVCGAKDPMSIDVENTILMIIQQCGSMTEEAAAAYLDALKDQGRYMKDVY
ncbi:MAG: flavodoxin domain-containing protein [Chitinophagaceae bacterium]|nr:flavodoxin domain-containing protein [Chitinophagaceae bacterium]